MGVDAATVGGALADAWEHLIVGIPAGWTRRVAGAAAVVTHADVPTLNGVLVYGADTSPEETSDLLDRVAEEGVPHCLQLCPRCDSGLQDVARSRLMRREADIPLMVLEDLGEQPRVGHGDLAINLLDPRDAIRHADVAAAGFQVPADIFRRLMRPSVLERPGVRSYLGEVDGEPVATGIGVRLDESVGIFNIATLPTHQRRGYGAAITSRAVRDGFVEGARWAWLQSSAAGHGLYEKLGFTTLESWQCWVSS